MLELWPGRDTAQLCAPRSSVSNRGFLSISLGPLCSLFSSCYPPELFFFLQKQKAQSNGMVMVLLETRHFAKLAFYEIPFNIYLGHMSLGAMTSTNALGGKECS